MVLMAEGPSFAEAARKARSDLEMQPDEIPHYTRAR